jgi:hypothetical protein
MSKYAIRKEIRMSNSRKILTALSVVVLGLLAVVCVQRTNAETAAKRIPLPSTLNASTNAATLNGSIVPYNPDVHGPLGAALSKEPVIMKQQKFMKVFTNKWQKNITALTFKWTYTKPGELKERGAVVTRDSYFLRYDVIPSGAQLLVAPAALMNLKTANEGMIAGYTIAPQLIEELNHAPSLEFSTDLIMFEDGSTLGPDTLHTVDRLWVRQAEAKYIHDRLVHGESLDSIVAKKMATRPLLNDPGMQVIRKLRGMGKNADTKTLIQILEAPHALPVVAGGTK